MNLFLTSLSLIIISLFFSCDSKPPLSSTLNSSSTTSIERNNALSNISIDIDSIVKVTSDVGWIADNIENSYLIVTKDRSKVIIYDEDRKTKSITVAGEGPNKISSIHKAGFLSTNTFIVADISSVATYSFDGIIDSQCKNISSKINLGMDLRMKGTNENEIILGCLNPLNEISSSEYFENSENFFVSKLNIESCNVTPIGRINENSIYKKIHLPIRYRVLWDAALSHNVIATVMPFDKIVDFYNIESNKLLNSISLSPQHFNDIVPVDGDDLSSKLRAMQMNSSYVKIILSEDAKSLLTYYQRGTDEPIDNLDYLNSNSTSSSRYIELYRDARKVGDDIKMEGSLIPIKFISDDRILFYSTNIDDEEGVFFHYGTIIGSD
jgi:hypothetical protein